MINYVNEQYQIIKLAFLIKVKVNKMMCINCEERIALLSKKNITQVNKSRVDLTFEIKKDNERECVENHQIVQKYEEHKNRY